jgi:HSP20 family protein
MPLIHSFLRKQTNRHAKCVIENINFLKCLKLKPKGKIMKLIRYTIPNIASDLSHSFNWEPIAFNHEQLFNRAFSDDAILSHKPVSNIREDKDNYYVDVDIPGVKKDEIKLNLNRNVLSLSTEIKEEKEGNYRRTSYSQSYSLPENIDQDKIKAELEDGVLKVTLPKAEEQKAKSITIA